MRGRPDPWRPYRFGKVPAVALTAALMASCASGPEYVEIAPDCSVPPQPALPAVTAADFNQGEALPDGGRRLAPGESFLSDELFARTGRREAALVGWALELRAALSRLCADE